MICVELRTRTPPHGESASIPVLRRFQVFEITFDIDRKIDQFRLL